MKAFLLISLLFLVSCSGGGGGTTTGNPVKTVNVRMQDQQPFAWMKKISDSLITSANANSSNVSLCFKRLRFKPVENDDSSAENYDLALGLVTIDPNGTNIASVSVPEGTYRRIEFDLEANCNGTIVPSVSFTNLNGTFSSEDNIKIKFEGILVVDADKTLNLNIDAILDAMDSINSGDDIENDLENALGDF
jgi:hypothetical protein